MQKTFRCPIRLQQVVIPHEGTIKAIAEYNNNSYLIIEHLGNHILLCVSDRSKWHIKLPLEATHLKSDHNGLYIGGKRYTNAQKIYFNTYILCFSHRGRLLWKYTHPHLNEDIWGLVPLGDLSVFCLMMLNTGDGYRLRHMRINKIPLWSNTQKDIHIQQRFFHYNRIAPKLLVHNEQLLSLGAYQLPQSRSAIAFFVFSRDTGDILHRYTAPHPNAYYVQSAISPKGHLAIAWQTYRQQLDHTHLLLFDTKHVCIGEYHSYLHCWLGLCWHEKSLFIAGKSRDNTHRPSLERIGKNKSFQEYSGEELVGYIHTHQNMFSYQHKNPNGAYELIFRNFEGNHIQTFPLKQQVQDLFYSTHSTLAYKKDAHSLAIIKPSLDPQ